MLRLLPVLLLFTVPDAGFSWPEVREQLMRCDLDEKVQISPQLGGDYWAPGEWPYSRH